MQKNISIKPYEGAYAPSYVCQRAEPCFTPNVNTVLPPSLHVEERGKASY